jgi:hypothetical protein
MDFSRAVLIPHLSSVREESVFGGIAVNNAGTVYASSDHYNDRVHIYSLDTEATPTVVHTERPNGVCFVQCSAWRLSLTKTRPHW